MCINVSVSLVRVRVGRLASLWCDRGAHLLLVHSILRLLTICESVRHVVVLVIVYALAGLPTTQHCFQHLGAVLLRWLEQLLHRLLYFRE